jgi:hypothetical protein
MLTVDDHYVDVVFNNYYEIINRFCRIWQLA